MAASKSKKGNRGMKTSLNPAVATKVSKVMKKLDSATNEQVSSQLDKTFNKIMGNLNGHFLSTKLPSTQDITEDNFRRILEEVTFRHNFIGKHLSSKTALSNFLRAHKTKDIIKRRIIQAVKENSSALPRSERARQANTTDDDYDQYCSLVRAHFVNPSFVFTDLPDTLTLCQLKALWYWHQGKTPPKKGKNGSQDKIGEIIEEALKAKIGFLTNQWKAISGRDLRLESLRIGDIESWKAPVPYRPAWTEYLYNLEAAKMKNKLASHKEDSGSVASVRVPEKPPVKDRTEDIRREEITGETAPCQQCDFASLYELAGGRVPRQPGSSPDDKLYTFPGELDTNHENIFYDYALIIPVEDCGPYSELNLLTPRNLTASKILIGKAQSILRFLKDSGLARAMGMFGQSTGLSIYRTVVDEVMSLLDDVLKLLPGSSTSEVRNIRSRLLEMAGLMRTAARAEMYMSGIPGKNPQDFLQNLDDAIQNFPYFEKRSRRVPTTDEREEMYCDTLCFPTTNWIYTWGTKYPADQPNVADNFFNVPDADAYSWHNSTVITGGGSVMSKHDGDAMYPRITQGWTWDLFHAQRNDLRNYVRFLGEEIYPKLTNLMTAARNMRDTVRDFSTKDNLIENDLRRLSTGIVNEAARSLSYMLGETADVLTLPPVSESEGSKRLALQVIFRQYWHPDGYVMGKLVGYKNLIPNQKETLKRRTFIKTTRELVKAEEFATSRQDEYSRSQKETAEVIKEASKAFNFNQNVSGHYDTLVWGVQAQLQFGESLTQASKSTQSMISEATMKGSASYSDKREVKIRELQETEDVQEVTSELANLNQEITANYFYYQLLRQYQVTMDLNDIRPVLLRKRHVPSPSEIDEDFVATYAHILLHCLPPQLSADAQETADNMEGLTRTYLRKRSDMYDAGAKLDSFRKDAVVPDAQADAAGYNRHMEELKSREREFSEAKSAYVEAEDQYAKARARMARVIRHLRDNIRYYMQFIWQASPKVDEDYLLKDEKFYGVSLPAVTRGLTRLGYFGDEEVFEYVGPSVALMDHLLSNLKPGNKVIESHTEAELDKTPLMQYLKRYYPESKEDIKDRIRSQAFVVDPAALEEVFPVRSVQIAQDALVVETMPGQVPLLEGFQMAHRMLDVQKACLENVHLTERIADRPWKSDGHDTYGVRRYEGDVPPTREVKEE